jgi:hypothetical protein
MADVKITDLPALTTPAGVDLLPIVDDPSGSPATKKITLSSLQSALVRRDTRANQPAASAVATGTLYYVTDESLLERSNGTAWEAVSATGASPSNTVAALTGTGTAGVALEYSRGDHTHTDVNRPTTDQKAALAGTSGAPAAGNPYVTDADARNTNARTPTAHASSHQAGGGDPIKLDDLAAPDDNTDLNASASAHGLLPKLSGNAAEFLNGQGAFATPAGGGDVSGPASAVDDRIATFDGTTGKLLQDGGATIVEAIASAVAASGDVDGPASAVDGEVALFDGTSGKLLKRASATGVAKVASGVLSAGQVALGSEVSGDLPLANLAQASAESKLMGRGEGSGAGDFQEIALGTNLSMSGATLNAAGGGGSQAYQLGITIDGAGSVLTTGVKGFIAVPVTGTITGARLLSTDPSATAGDIVIDVWKDSYANYPPTDADSITAAAPPTLSGANKSDDTTLTGWTTSVTAGDILGFSVDSAATVTRVTLILTITPS